MSTAAVPVPLPVLPTNVTWYHDGVRLSDDRQRIVEEVEQTMDRLFYREPDPALLLTRYFGWDRTHLESEKRVMLERLRAAVKASHGNINAYPLSRPRA